MPRRFKESTLVDPFSQACLTKWVEITKREQESFQELKAASLFQVLFRTARLINEEATARLRETGQMPLRVAHTNLLPHIDFEGVRPTELARRMGISKQAVGQLLQDLEAHGTLERVADPADRRAKLVRYTDQGLKNMKQGIRLLQDLERTYSRELGAGYAQLQKSVHALNKVAERRALVVD